MQLQDPDYWRETSLDGSRVSLERLGVGQRRGFEVIDTATPLVLASCRKKPSATTLLAFRTVPAIGSIATSVASAVWGARRCKVPPGPLPIERSTVDPSAIVTVPPVVSSDTAPPFPAASNCWPATVSNEPEDKTTSPDAPDRSHRLWCPTRRPSRSP